MRASRGRASKHSSAAVNTFESIVSYLTLGRRKVWEPYLAKLKATEGMQMRTCIGIVVVVAIGLIWSVAAMSKWVPAPSAELSSSAMLHRR
jgi:hypothetical protein